MVATGQLISAIHDGPCQAVLAVTGGGSGALEQLLAVPGASRTVLEAVVPYCQPSLTDWLGGPVEQACSEPTARAMAMAAWLRARELTPEGDGAPLVGLGATASLATDRPKRGEQRIHVATQTATATRSLSLGLEKGRRTRTEEEGIASLVVLIALAEACGVDAAEALDELDSMLAKSERLERRECQAPTEWIELLAGERTWVVVGPEPNVSGGEDDGRGDASPVPVAMLSGAFHPPHDGHRQMAQMAEHLLGKPVAWELSIRNVDKRPLDFLEIADRTGALREADPRRPVVLTSAATFREKAALFPSSRFVVGADTILRIADPRYYGNSQAERDAAVDQLAAAGCRLLVFGRLLDGRFQTLGDLPLPAGLLALCDEVPAAEFRADISSTELRAGRDSG